MRSIILVLGLIFSLETFAEYSYSGTTIKCYAEEAVNLLGPDGVTPISEKTAIMLCLKASGVAFNGTTIDCYKESRKLNKPGPVPMSISQDGAVDLCYQSSSYAYPGTVLECYAEASTLKQPGSTIPISNANVLTLCLRKRE